MNTGPGVEEAYSGTRLIRRERTLATPPDVLEHDPLGAQPVGTHVHDSHRGGPLVGRHSLPEPQVRTPLQAGPLAGITLFRDVDGAGGEHARPTHLDIYGHVQVAVHDEVNRAEPTAHVPVQPEQHCTPAGKAHGGGGHLDGTAAPAVHEADAATPHGHDALTREVNSREQVVIALHGDDRGDLPEPLEYRRACDVPRMEDEIARREGLHHLRGQLGEHLAHMGVGNHANADGAAQMAIAW